MPVPYLVVIPNDFPNKYSAEYKVLVDMVGDENVFRVEKDIIHRKLAKTLWKATFNKLWLFHLVAYDKLIVLRLIRQNIMHWFDYPAPAATQAGDNIEWNSGAMVIEPNNQVFQQMMDLLPNVTRHDVKRTQTNDSNSNNNSNTLDGWNSGIGQQGFLSSFFTHESLNRTYRMKTMPTEASILSSSFVRPQFGYFVHNRPHIFETIHFTVHKPWRISTSTSNLHLCAMLLEWKVSMEGFEKYNTTIVLENDYLRDCLQTTTV